VVDMTRHHFELLARLVAGEGSRFKSNAAHAGFAGDLADALRWESPRFDRRRFVEACRPSWVPGTRAEAAWELVARAS
jgi:hypothetical protein